jgi:ssDNA thymidine ADP-ribosyltransferase DarT-like protein
MDFTDFFDDFKDLGRIDWSLMQAKYWFDNDSHPDRSRRRQAEFLVYQFLPWNLVTKIVVYDAANAKVVRNILGGQLPAVDINRGWYY